ncbi:hypothetical protein, partial [Flavobacterium sp.]|uniref:hypothetical protein n=1 Tax=Flavobacterium sp. TaxID=239 RepID=UPI003783D783
AISTSLIDSPGEGTFISKIMVLYFSLCYWFYFTECPLDILLLISNSPDSFGSHFVRVQQVSFFYPLPLDCARGDKKDTAESGIKLLII